MLESAESLITPEETQDRYYPHKYEMIVFDMVAYTLENTIQNTNTKLHIKTMPKGLRK